MTTWNQTSTVALKFLPPLPFADSGSVAYVAESAGSRTWSSPRARRVDDVSCVRASNAAHESNAVAAGAAAAGPAVVATSAATNAPKASATRARVMPWSMSFSPSSWTVRAGA